MLCKPQRQLMFGLQISAVCRIFTACLHSRKNEALSLSSGGLLDWQPYRLRDWLMVCFDPYLGYMYPGLLFLSPLLWSLLVNCTPQMPPLRLRWACEIIRARRGAPMGRQNLLLANPPSVLNLDPVALFPSRLRNEQNGGTVTMKFFFSLIAFREIYYRYVN